MKKLVVALFLFTSVTVSAQSTELEKAQQKAKAEQKNILLLFSGSDWCIPCIKMEKEVIEQASFQQYANEHLVIIKADFPRLKKNQLPKEIHQQNEALAAIYNKKGAFPYTLLLNAEGQVLKEWEGLIAPSPENFIKQLDSVPDAK